MPSRAAPRFVLFDYGNTLVPFGRREAGIIARAQARVVAGRVPGVDAEAFAPEVLRVKDGLVRGTRDTGRECTAGDLAAALAAAAGAPCPPAGLAEALEEATGACFASSLRLPPDTLPVLDALRPRFRLALVSNYFLVPPILRSLEGFGIAARLEAAVVSAEVGWVKPRPEPFREVLRRLGAEPGECVFVGDNLHADVGGAGALGMRTVHTVEWLADALPADAGAADPGAPRPDAVVARLAELPGVLSR